jgi:UPF0271 protein
MIVDLNSDLGEGFGIYKLGDDAEMLKIVSSANIACGYHAGDPLIMHETAELARKNGVQVGAHPGYRDLWGFGRRPIQGEAPGDVEKLLTYQIGAMCALAIAAGTRVRHVKTHGALGNLAAVDIALARSVAKAVRTIDRDLILVVMPKTEMERAGEEAGLRLAREIYADRAYEDDGNLVSRRKPEAVIHDADQAVTRVLRMIEERAILCDSGNKIPTSIDTICVHGDTAGAVAMARHLRSELERAGATIAPMTKVLGMD